MEGAAGADLEEVLILKGETCLEGEKVLGFLRGARVLGLFLGVGSEVGTGGQPNEAGGELEPGLPGLTMMLALTLAATLALRIALVDKRGGRVGGVSLLGGWRGIGGIGRHCIG